jgi:enterochelin esterase-like enzyme
MLPRRSPTLAYLALLALVLIGCSASARAEAPVIIITATPSPTIPATATEPGPHTPGFSPFASATPTDTTTPLPPCPEKQGQVSKIKLKSPALDNETVPFNIYLPPCYNLYSQRRYPVLYLIHGVAMNEDSWVELGAATDADQLIGTGEIPPFIIVMPKAPDDERFTATVVFDLVPYIDSHYRTFPDRTYRALGGMSRGGGWTVRIGFQYPYMFGSLGMHSLAIMFADEDKVVGWLNRLPDDALPRIYMDIGKDDSLVDSASWLDAALTTRYVDHEWHLNPGNHDTKYWETHLPDYLRWYSANW